MIKHICVLLRLPVSYTHLDVYKRQVIRIVIESIVSSFIKIWGGGRHDLGDLTWNDPKINTVLNELSYENEIQWYTDITLFCGMAKKCFISRVALHKGPKCNYLIFWYREKVKSRVAFYYRGVISKFHCSKVMIFQIIKKMF